MSSSIRTATNVIERAVDRSLCSGCGVCAGVCPQRALSMQLAENGDLVPVLRAECRRCGTCLAVCPFIAGVHDPRNANRALFGPQGSRQSAPVFSQDIGWFRATLVGHSDEHRPLSASGGLLTSCLERLLALGEIDRAAVVAPVVTNQGPSFTFRFASSAHELRACVGSVYQPVEISHLLGQMREGPQANWAIVGVPCLCAAVRKATSRLARVRKAIRYVLGLACGMYQNRFYTELLCEVSGVPLSRAGTIRYRIKGNGPPSDYGFCATAVDGWRGDVVRYQGLPAFLGVNGYFRINACDFCRDVFAESADACFMDAWVAPYSDDPKGESLVVVRESRLETVFADMARNVPGVRIWPAPMQAVLSSQAGQIWRKRQLIRARLGQSSGICLSDRVDCWLQSKTQHRSKSAWARWGRRHRVAMFWLAMGDLWLLQHCYRALLRLRRLVVRAVGSAFRRQR